MDLRFGTLPIRVFYDSNGYIVMVTFLTINVQDSPLVIGLATPVANVEALNAGATYLYLAAILVALGQTPPF